MELTFAGGASTEGVLARVFRYRAQSRLSALAIFSLVIVALEATLWAPAFAQSAQYQLSPLSVAPFELPEDALESDDRLFIENHRKLIVGVVKGSHPPYQFFDRENGFSGHAIEFLQMVSKAIGFELELAVFDDMSALLAAMEARQVDIIPSLESTTARRRSMLFTSGVTPTPAALVAKVADTTLLDNPVLAGVRVAVDPDSEAATNLSIQFPEAIAYPVSSAEQARKVLLEGKASLYYGPVLSLFALEEQAQVQLLEVKQRVYYGTGWNHIAVRSDWPRVTALYERFVSNGRSSMDQKLADVVGERLARQLPPVSMTPFQSAYLSGFSSLKVGAINGFGLINGVDANGNHVGIASEFTAFVGYQLGLTLEVFGYDTAAEMQSALESGEINLIPFFGNTFERRRRFTFSDSYMSMPWLLVGNVADAQYWNLASLGQARLALRYKHPLVDWIARNYPELEVVFTDTDEGAFEMVSRGHADATVEMKLVTNRMLNSEFGGKLRVLDELSEVDGSFGFATTAIAAPLIPLINGALAQMDDALRNRLIRRWIAVDFQPEARLKSILSFLLPLAIGLFVFMLVILYWTRRLAKENHKRTQAEQLLVDMTDRLRTGVFQFRQYKGKSPILEFSNALTRHMARMSPEDGNTSHHNFFDYIHQEDRDWVKQKMRDCLSSRQHFRETFRFDFPNHEKGWILADAHCRVDKDGANVWSGYLFDLTSERLLSEELNELLISRDKFMSTSGHELKTPLQSLSLALEGISTDNDPEQSDNLLAAARSSVDDLIELVDDFVELSSMNSRPLALKNEPYDFHELASSLSRTFTNAARKKSLSFDYQFDFEIPRMVWGDSMRVKQVLYNLLGNALKYTDEGSVFFHIALEHGDSGDNQRKSGNPAGDENVAEPVWVRIAVRDTGIGIEARYVPTIFQPFSTIGPATRESTGLGLAIVDRLTAVLGGSITVDTEEGVGTEFVLRLPLSTQKPDRALYRQPIYSVDDSDWNLHSKNLLVVDDNLLVRETLASLLEMDGWKVLQADSAASALSVLKSSECVALVTDQQMPGMTGIELARAVLDRTEKRGSRPVMIMMSGGMSRDDAHQANEVFDVVLFKPIKTAQIRNAILTATSAVSVIG